jgi:hypothetical protein
VADNGYENTPGDERDSGMRIEFGLHLGYRRRRPNTLGDRFEARIDSLGLLLVGSLVAVAIILVVLPRILDWLAQAGR